MVQLLAIFLATTAFAQNNPTSGGADIINGKRIELVSDLSPKQDLNDLINQIADNLLKNELAKETEDFKVVILKSVLSTTPTLNTSIVVETVPSKIIFISKEALKEYGIYDLLGKSLLELIVLKNSRPASDFEWNEIKSAILKLKMIQIIKEQRDLEATPSDSLKKN